MSSEYYSSPSVCWYWACVIFLTYLRNKTIVADRYFSKLPQIFEFHYCNKLYHIRGLPTLNVFYGLRSIPQARKMFSKVPRVGRLCCKPSIKTDIILIIHKRGQYNFWRFQWTSPLEHAQDPEWSFGQPHAKSSKVGKNGDQCCYSSAFPIHWLGTQLVML